MSTNEQNYERLRRISDATHYVSDVKNLPSVPHYAVLVSKSLSYPDPYEDTNPSRSFSNTSSHRYVEYIAFDTEEALNDWLLNTRDRYDYKYTEFKAIKVNPVEVKFETSLKLIE